MKNREQKRIEHNPPNKKATHHKYLKMSIMKLADMHP